MLKVKEKNTGKNKVDPGSKVTKKNNQTKKLQNKKGAATLKKAVKGGLVKAPTPPSTPAPTPPTTPATAQTPNVGATGVTTILDPKKEKKRQKNLAKKLKKAQNVTENGKQKKEVIATEAVSPEQNGEKTETTALVSELATKKVAETQDKKKKKKAKPDNPVREKTGKPPGSPEQTVFVGNLPTNTKRAQLMKLFSPYGQVLAIRFRTASGKVIFKHKARKEAGTLNAYIVLKDVEAVAKALALNGTDFKGNHLRVTKTEKLEEEVDSKRMVFVGNLKSTATDDKLHQIFSSCGELEYVRTLQDPSKGGCKGVAFVCFKNPDSVGLALELKDTILDERPIHVERYTVGKLGAKAKRDAEDDKKGQPPQKRTKFVKNGGDFKKNVARDGDRKNKFVNKKGGDFKKNIARDGDRKNKFNNRKGGDFKKNTAPGDSDKKKKSEFRGVKSDANKKKQKKKLPSAMKKLAKKIAPNSDK